MERAAIIILVIINVAAFLLYGYDKYRAVQHKWRISEAALLAIAICGGSAGAYLAMQCFHHKTKKNRFRIGVPLILILQAALIAFARQFFLRQ